MHFALKPKGQMQREDNSYKLTTGQRKFSYELTFWFILIKTVANKKEKNILRVEINQFCDSLRDTMRSFYVIDKM